MNIIENIQGVLLKHEVFYKSLGKQKDIQPAALHYAILALIPALIAAFVLSTFFSPFAPSPVFGGGPVLLFIGSWISALVGSFLLAGVAMFVVRAVKGKADYVQNYQAYAYGATPALLLGWFPVIGILFVLYSWYLQFKGLTILNNLTQTQGIIAFVAVLLISIVLSVVTGLGMAALSLARLF